MHMLVVRRRVPRVALQGAAYLWWGSGARKPFLGVHAVGLSMMLVKRVLACRIYLYWPNLL